MSWMHCNNCLISSSRKLYLFAKSLCNHLLCWDCQLTCVSLQKCAVCNCTPFIYEFMESVSWIITKMITAQPEDFISRSTLQFDSIIDMMREQFRIMTNALKYKSETLNINSDKSKAELVNLVRNKATLENMLWRYIKLREYMKQFMLSSSDFKTSADTVWHQTLQNYLLSRREDTIALLRDSSSDESTAMDYSDDDDDDGIKISSVVLE